jgi:phage terminase large subunit
MTISFDTHGNDKQKECAKAWTDQTTIDIVYGGAKGGAKSYTGCSLIFGDAFLYPETHYFIARKTLADIRKFTIPSVHEVFNSWGLNSSYYKFNGQDNLFQLNNGSKVFLLEAKHTPSDPKYYRFGSMQMTRGWIEEAGEFNRDAKANLQASLGRWKNEEYGLKPKLLQTCNPAHNYLYTEYYKKWKDGSIEDWKKFIQALPQDNKMLPKDYVSNLLRILSTNEIERLIYGNWEYDDDPSALVDYDAICDLFTNDHVIGGDSRISADLAMQGRDRFVAGHWDGLIAYLDIDQPKATGKSIVDDLTQLKIKHGVPSSRVVADSDGMGAYLDSYMNNITTFHGNSSANNKEYSNIKSECGFKLAELITSRSIKIVCPVEKQEIIKTELSVCLKRDNIDSDESKKRLISKDKMKDLLGHSPDYFDWLLMGMYFEVKQEYRLYG